MIISLEELSSLSAEDIYQKLATFFDNIYSSNSFSGLTYSEYKKIILEEIETSKEEYTGTVNYIKYIKKLALKRLNFNSDFVERNNISEYIRDIGNIEYYDKSIENDLIKKAQNGDLEARNTIVENYLKLVISIAKRYVDKGLSLEDLIQEGNIGLIKAIKKYDDKKGSKFSTYAVWWIRQTVTRSLADKGKTIRIPVHLYEKLALFRKTQAILEKELGRMPTDLEVANKMNISEDTLNLINKINPSIASLNDKLFEEQDLELADIIANDEDPVDNQVIDVNLKNDVKTLLDSLNFSEREMEIIRLRYGFGDKEPMTLEEVGKIYGITRERVRQLENRVLEKIRGSQQIYNYIGYMDSPEKEFKNIKKMNTSINNKKREKKYRINEDIYYNEETGFIEKNKIPSIYGVFYNFPTYKVDMAISKLNLMDQFFVYLRNGGNLEEPYIYEITKNQIKYFNDVIIPSIRKELYKVKAGDTIANNQSILLNSNTFTKLDLIKLKKLFDKYINSGISYYLTINQFFIKVFNNGYIDGKKYSKDDILNILHLSSFEYDSCIKEESEIKKDKDNDYNIKKYLKKI